ncbi:hypothetical protein Tco_1369515 [Tanacetum coccineum]
MTDHVAHLDKESQTNKILNESLTAELERYKERIAIFEQRLNVDLNKREKLIDSQMDDLIRDRNAKLAAFQQEIDTLKETLCNNVKEKESLSKTLTVFKTESKEKESNVIAKENVMIYVLDDEETLILEEESRSKMLDKQNDTISIEKKIKISPIDYSTLNKIKEDFGKWLLEHTKDVLSLEIISFLTVLKGTFNAFDKTLLDEIIEVQTVFNQMEAAVDQSNVSRNCAYSCAFLWIVLMKKVMCRMRYAKLETELLNKKDFIEKEAYDKLVKSYSNLEKHCILLELATQLNQEIFLRENSGENLNAPTSIRKLKETIKYLSGKDSVDNVKKDVDEIETINIELEHNLNAQIQEKFFAITALKNELRKLKGKNVVNIVVSKPNATLAPGMFKLDIEPISPRLKNNRDAHEVYIEKTIEYTDTLHGFVERARTQYPSEPLLESACMFTKHDQELLVYASKTCPNSPKPSKKLVVVTPINKDKRVRFVEPVTSSSSIPKQTDSLKIKDSNKPVLTST